ncbi:MAG: Mu-like prophage major head subunit gpT family protein [Gammaproteobacteria bacterium]|nr:Mu-like prophage major head subunit gpT family protein [Gammaproteobacteria bacterium]
MNKTELLKAMAMAFKAEFQRAFSGVEPTYTKVAMLVSSKTAMNTYAWLGQFPKMREWVGQRQIEKMTKEAMAIENKKFEATVGVERTEIEDDQVGLYKPMMAEMGQSAGELPDDLVWTLLPKGKTTLCYDGKNFFDTEHPVYEKTDGTGTVTGVSNITVGASKDTSSWYVIDDTRSLKPIVFQERTKAEFETKFDPSKSDKVFMEDVYLWGARARCNAGFALWQLAHMAEKTPLTKENLSKIITSMRTMNGNGDKRLGIRPSLLVVPPELEDTARELLEADRINGTTNTYKGKIKLHVCEWL